MARIEQGFSQVYSRYLSRCLKGKLRLRLDDFAGLPLDSTAGLRGRTLRDFDEHVTAQGGHVAFMATGRGGGVRCWAEETIADWFAEFI